MLAKLLEETYRLTLFAEPLLNPEARSPHTSNNSKEQTYMGLKAQTGGICPVRLRGIWSQIGRAHV